MLIGLAALTRNEAVWLALIWAAIAWLSVRAIPRPCGCGSSAWSPSSRSASSRRGRSGTWSGFGSPLPGQAVTNALSVTGFDIFAWNDPPTLSTLPRRRPGARSSRCASTGLAHNLFNVLLLLGLPISVIGLLALPVAWPRPRHPAGRSSLSLDHVPRHEPALPGRDARGARSCTRPARSTSCSSCRRCSALDAGIARLGSRAWAGRSRSPGSARAARHLRLAPVLGRAPARRSAPGRAATAGALRGAGRHGWPAIGHPLDASAGPVITNFPIWLAETQRIPSLALPDEPPRRRPRPRARFPGTRLLVLISRRGRRTGPPTSRRGCRGRSASVRVELGPPTLGISRGRTSSRTCCVFEIVCP